MKLNQKIVDSLELPDGKKDVTYWDEECPGLAVRLQGNARRWVVRYRPAGQSVQRTVTLGPLAGIPLRKARELAIEYTRPAKQGVDRVVIEKSDAAEARRLQRSRSEGRLGAVVERYLTHAEREVRPSTLRELRRYLRGHWLPLHAEIADSLDKRDVIARLEVIAVANGPTAANRARSYLSMALAWGVKRGILNGNPVAGIAALTAEKARQRVLTADEIRRLWCETDRPGDYAKIVRLLLLTAARREEVGAMRWSEVSLERALWTIPGARTKNGRPCQLPLSTQAAAIIEAQPVRPGRDLVFGSGKGGFSGWGKSKERSDQRSGLGDWKHHDLRRTAVTSMAEIGIQPHVIEAIVNHVSGHKNGVAGIYNRATYANEKKIALQQWADHLNWIVGHTPDATIVQLHSVR